MAKWDGLSPVEKFAKRIQELEDQVKALAATSTHMPFADSDPSTAYGNMWMFNDNRIRIRKPDGTIREIITTAPGTTSTGTTLPPPVAQTSTKQQTWNASFTQTYRGNGQQRSETLLHVGSGQDSFNGTQTALVGWPYATIASALAGSVITAVELFLYATHCWWNSGSTINIASQFNASAPSTLSGINTGVLSSVRVRGADQGGGGSWSRISTQFGGFLRDSTSQGIALVPTSADPSFYAILGGVGSGVPAPQLRITYVS